MFVVGTQLALLPGVKPSFKATTFSMLVRFLLMPGVSLLFVWATAGRGWYVDDKLVWYVAHRFVILSCPLLNNTLYRFLLVLIPSGPSAMVLANVSELVDVDQGPIAGYLTISVSFLAHCMRLRTHFCLVMQYLFSPLMAVVTSLALLVVDTASKR